MLQIMRTEADYDGFEDDVEICHVSAVPETSSRVPSRTQSLRKPTPFSPTHFTHTVSQNSAAPRGGGIHFQVQGAKEYVPVPAIACPLEKLSCHFSSDYPFIGKWSLVEKTWIWVPSDPLLTTNFTRFKQTYCRRPVNHSPCFRQVHLSWISPTLRSSMACDGHG